MAINYEKSGKEKIEDIIDKIRRDD